MLLALTLVSWINAVCAARVYGLVSVLAPLVAEDDWRWATVLGALPKSACCWEGSHFSKHVMRSFVAPRQVKHGPNLEAETEVKVQFSGEELYGKVSRVELTPLD